MGDRSPKSKLRNKQQSDDAKAKAKAKKQKPTSEASTLSLGAKKR